MRSPTRSITAGTIVIRTRKASARTPTASAKPSVLMMNWSPVMKPAKTPVMMIAAAVTTRALCVNPWRTASCAELPWTYSSRIRETRKTS